jgi:heat-inducible transcriptional repressor
MPTDDFELNDRAQQLLKTLVEAYIRDGQPVGSRALSRDSGLSLSAATVRNVMSDLEDLGYVRAPHTSAGRVPTSKGYRVFVDSLLKVQPLSVPEVQRMERELGEYRHDTSELAAAASKLLSGLTRLVAVVTLPRNPGHQSLRQIEFLPLSDNRALAILVVNEHEVHNRIIQLDRAYTETDLRAAANFLNEQFRGRTIPDVRRMLLEELQRTRESVNRLMLDAIHLAAEVLQPRPGEVSAYVLAGETHLMECQELSDMDKLRRLFEAFNRQRDILRLLDQSLSAEGVQLFIGQESGHQMLEECSVVTAPYTAANKVVGVLGVIGPTRMAYERVIPAVDMTARLVGAALNYSS